MDDETKTDFNVYNYKLILIVINQKITNRVYNHGQTWTSSWCNSHKMWTWNECDYEFTEIVRIRKKSLIDVKHIKSN